MGEATALTHALRVAAAGLGEAAAISAAARSCNGASDNAAQMSAARTIQIDDVCDGTLTTQPEYSHWLDDVGWNVENYGTDPDIVVENTPQDYAAGIDRQLERSIEIRARAPRPPRAAPQARRRAAPRRAEAARA